MIRVLPLGPQKPPFELSSLSNGTRILTQRLKHLSGVYLFLSFQGGSRHIPIKQIGLPHLVEHAIWLGTRARSKDEISAWSDRFHTANGYTWTDIIGLTGRTQREKWLDQLDLFTELVREASIPKAHMRSERGVLRGERRRSLSDPYVRCNTIFEQILWNGNPLGYDPDEVMNISHITDSDVRGYIEQNFVGCRLLIGVVGDISRRRVVSEISKRFSTLRPGKPLEMITPYPSAGLKLTPVDSSSCPVTYIQTGFGVPGLNFDEAITGELVGMTLGGLESAQFYRQSRDRGDGYSLRCHTALGRDCGSFQLAGDIERREINRTLRAFYAVLDRFTEHTVDSKLLARAKEKLTDLRVLQMDEPDKSLGDAMERVTWGDHWTTIVERKAAIARVTQTDLVGYVRRYLAHRPPALSILGDLRGFELAPDIRRRCLAN